jgi:hypothetical protein
MKAAMKKRFLCDLCLAAVSIVAGVVIGSPLGLFVGFWAWPVPKYHGDLLNSSVEVSISSPSAHLAC